LVWNDQWDKQTLFQHPFSWKAEAINTLHAGRSRNQWFGFGGQPWLCKPTGKWIGERQCEHSSTE
jgi:hypothetical protein